MQPEFETQITTATEADIKIVVNGINSYNLAKHPTQAPTWTPLEFAAKDKNGTLMGGVLGGIGYWNGLEIKLLWVDEKYRNQGLGTQILEHMEQAAKSKGAVISMLDTFDFQAEGFYLKNGYTPIGEIKEFPKGHRRIYFSKRLD
jgi:GNAT superfamily N-acetyltransferase